MATPRVSLPSLRAFLGAIGLSKTATASTNLGLRGLQGGSGQTPLTQSDSDVRDVVNAIRDAVDVGTVGRMAIVNIGINRASDYVMSVAEASAPLIEVHGTFDGSGYTLRCPPGFSMPDGAVQTIRDRSTYPSPGTNTGLASFAAGATALTLPQWWSDTTIRWSGGVPIIANSFSLPGTWASLQIPDAPQTPDITVWSFMTIRCPGVMTADRKVTLPLIPGRTWVIYNDTTGGHNLIVGGATGTTVSLPASGNPTVFCSGVDFFQ
jgi:hypothetical protein